MGQTVAVVTSDGMESNGVQSAWSTCIAEVALPASFKLKNVEATNRASQRPNSTHRSNVEMAKMPFSRFAITDQSARLHRDDLVAIVGHDKSEAIEQLLCKPVVQVHVAAIDPAGEQQTSSGQRHKRHHGSSNDDKALQQFRKVGTAYALCMCILSHLNASHACSLQRQMNYRR